MNQVLESLQPRLVLVPLRPNQGRLHGQCSVEVSLEERGSDELQAVQNFFVGIGQSPDDADRGLDLGLLSLLDSFQVA